MSSEMASKLESYYGPLALLLADGSPGGCPTADRLGMRLLPGSERRRNALGLNVTFVRGGPSGESDSRHKPISIRLRSTALPTRPVGCGELPSATLGGSLAFRSLPPACRMCAFLKIKGILLFVGENLFEKLVIIVNVFCKPGRIL